MKTRLQIRGIIVDSSWDCEEGTWFDQFIQRGVLTPESRVRMALDQCEKNGDEVEVEICSPGGSVFSGIELANRIANYKGEISVQVGAYAASAAALIVLEAARAGKAVSAFRNSILLYHGAWAVTKGGRGAHADEAKLLEQINAPMMDALKAFGVPAAKVERGFEEGRQLTMTADEAHEYGIISTIIGEAAAGIAPVSADDANSLLAHGIGGLAAFSPGFDPAAALADGHADLDIFGADYCAHPNKTSSDFSESSPGGLATQAPGDGVSPPAAQAAAGGEPITSSPPVGPSCSPGGADTSSAELSARIDALLAENRALQSAKDKEVSAVRNALTEQINGLQSALAAKEGELETYRAEMDKQLSTLHTELVDWKAKYEAESAKRAALVGAVNSQDPDDQPADWPAAISRFGAANALRLFPGLAADYRKTHGAKSRR